MRTRAGCCYPSESATAMEKCKRKRQMTGREEMSEKRLRREPNSGPPGVNHFDDIPDDLLISVLAKLSCSAKCPADFMNVLLTCKRFNTLGLHPLVLSTTSTCSFAVKASSWSSGAHNFMKRCAEAGNIEACYTLGMIRFYCLENRGGGASLMAKAAISSHAAALYSLAIIQFNGSGGTKKDKDLKAGVALCARSAFLGHVDALRELGHCLQDGYGVTKNITEGRRFLVQANARELASILPAHYFRAHQDTRLQSFEPWLKNLNGGNRRQNLAAGSQAFVQAAACPLLSDFGCNVPVPELHPANKFLVDWFKLRLPGFGLRLCSHRFCGRPETRRHEFRRCSVCGTVNYCSRACQALDWKIRHKHNCTPIEDWLEQEDDDEEMGEDEEDIVIS